MSRLNVIAGLGMAGCAVDFGGGVAGQVNDAHAVWTSQMAISTKPLSTPINDDFLLLGAELQGRAETEVGARWNLGVRAGWGTSPDPVPGSWGWEAHADFGTPLRNGSLFPDGSLYYGATLAPVVWLSSQREAADLNQSSWFFKRAVELSPYLRLRVHVDEQPDALRIDTGIGLNLRLRIVNDFL